MIDYESMFLREFLSCPHDQVDRQELVSGTRFGEHTGSYRSHVPLGQAQSCHRCGATRVIEGGTESTWVRSRLVEDGSKGLAMSSCVLILDEHHRLLTVSRRDGSGWCLPGGKTEPRDPSAKITACREVAEETGLFLTPGRLVLLHVGLSPSGRIVHLYHARKVTNEPVAREEGTAIAWMTFYELCSQTPFEQFYRTALPDGVWHLLSTERLVLPEVG